MKSSTEVLRELLDERGAEYRFNESTKVFEWHFEGTDGEGSAHATEVNGGINIIACSLTPEQAIEATLGRGNAGRYVGLRQGEYWERTENSDYYCGGCGWKVTDHDSYCPECGGALHKAALDSYNCTNSERSSERTTTVDETATWECVCDQIGRYGKRVTIHVMECSECGHTYEHVNGDYEYCPRCGRRVVEVDA